MIKSVLIEETQTYQRSNRAQRNSRCGGWRGANCGRLGRGRIETNDFFVGLHHAKRVAGQNLDILRIGAKQVEFPFPLLENQLLLSEHGLLLFKLRGQLAVALPFGMEGHQNERHEPEDDKRGHKAIGLVPDLGVAAAPGAELLHSQRVSEPL